MNRMKFFKMHFCKLHSDKGGRLLKDRICSNDPPEKYFLIQNWNFYKEVMEYFFLISHFTEQGSECKLQLFALSGFPLEWH